MSYYLVKFSRKGKRSTDTPEKMMIEASNVLGAQEKADTAARGGGGGKAILQLFNEIGLVSTRTSEGLWSS
jgi:hypothetical protein